MKPRAVLGVAVVTAVLAIACGKGGDKGSAGSATGGSATGGTSGGATAPASGDECKHVLICQSFPAARVDSLCGTTSATVVPVDTERPVAVGTCQYNNDKGDTKLMITRTCHPSAAGGSDMATKFYTLARAEKGPTVTTVDMPGIGDEAFYRSANDHSRAHLFVRKGNATIGIEHMGVTAATEDALKANCLVALYNELAAK